MAEAGERRGDGGSFCLDFTGTGKSQVLGLEAGNPNQMNPVFYSIHRFLIDQSQLKPAEAQSLSLVRLKACLS